MADDNVPVELRNLVRKHGRIAVASAMKRLIAKREAAKEQENGR